MDYPEYLFVKMCDEGSEVSHEASKCAVFKPFNYEPGKNIRNDERLVYEIHDLLAVLELLMENGLVEFKFDRSKIDAKREKLIHFAKHMGYLQGETVEHTVFIEKAIPAFGRI